MVAVGETAITIITRCLGGHFGRSSRCWTGTPSGRWLDKMLTRKMLAVGKEVKKSTAASYFRKSLHGDLGLSSRLGEVNLAAKCDAEDSGATVCARCRLVCMRRGYTSTDWLGVVWSVGGPNVSCAVRSLLSAAGRGGRPLAREGGLIKRS